MAMGTIEELTTSIRVCLDAFAICAIQDGYSLDCPPISNVVVHFVVQGEGSVEWASGRLDLRPGAILIIPKNLPKRISGRPPVSRIVSAEAGCPLSPGIVKFHAGDNKTDLILGCGSLRVTCPGGDNWFDYLPGPLLEQSSDNALPPLLQVILAEMSFPSVGSKSIIESAMRQILVCLLRSRAFEEKLSPFWLALVAPELYGSLEAMCREPQKKHDIDGLAKLAGMSRSRFTHHFAAALGQSPMQFLQTIRLRNAAGLLESSQQPVKVIAAAVGYPAPNHS